MSTILADDLADLTPAELAELSDVFADGELGELAALEIERREQARRVRGQARRDAIREEWHGLAYADYLAAEAECRGELVNRAGVAAGVRDGFALWSGPRAVAEKYASEELLEFWGEHPRVTVGEYSAQRAAGMRAARLDYLEQATEDTEDMTSEDITMEVTNEHDTADQHDRAGLGGDAQAGLRHERAADPVRPGRDGQLDGTAQAGQVRDPGPVRQPGRLTMRSFADVVARETMLLARRPWLVYGDVALVYGTGSLGKGRAVWSFIAAVTNGQPVGLDTESLDDAGDVITILPEDRTEESAIRRLVASGANPRRVWDMTRLPSGVRFKFSASDRSIGHLPELRAAVEELRAAGRNPRLVVVDPIGATIGDGTIQTARGARLFVERLQDFAEQCGVCVLLVAHPTADGKLQGSHALRDALRTVYHVTQDATDASLRVWTLAKGNDTPPGEAKPMRFTITEGPNGPRAVWVTTGQTAPAQAQARPHWRDELAARRAAKAARTVPAAVRTTPAAPKPAAAAYTVAVAANGAERVLARDVDMATAQRICAESTEGQAFARARLPLRWSEVKPGTWTAGNRAVHFAIVDKATVRRAV